MKSDGSGVMPFVGIKRIMAAPLFGESPPGGWANEIRPGDSIHTLIAVHTDAGIVGFGSVFAEGALVQAAVKHLERFFLGENALEPQRVSEKLHQNSFWFGRGGTITHAISGIDIALWDILGKYTGLPLCLLLGGRHREKVMPYCSLLMDEPARMADEIALYRDKGFKAFKIGWGPFGRVDNPKMDEAIVEAAASQLPKGGKLFVDAGASDAYWPNGLKWAMRTADMLADHDIGWFEEPLLPDALDDFVTLRKTARLPIAGGEVMTRRQSFLPYLAKGAFDIVQPDVTKVGGISEQMRIARTAQDFGIRYVGHGWNTALGLAADLQIAAALPDVDLVEYIVGSAYLDELTAAPYTLDENGMLDIPSAPGLGITLDPRQIERFSPEASDLFLSESES